MKDTCRIFAVNTGSTSTKIALFENETQLKKAELIMPPEELQNKLKAVEQLDYRLRMVSDFMEKEGIDVSDLDIIVARGGPVPYCEGGAYAVNEYMADVLTYAPTSQHESALSAMIGLGLTKSKGIPVIIYDAINTDEFLPVAAISGVPELRNRPAGHVLNTRKVGRELAKRIGKPYEECRFVIAHFGGSISVSAHHCGKIIDMVHAFNGPMSPQRAGRVSTNDLITLCFSGAYTESELRRKLNGKSGFAGYFGTQDARKVLKMVEDGDDTARLVVDALAYQCAKGVAEMTIALNGEVDRIIFTGGMAHSRLFTDLVAKRVAFLAPVEIFPGEYEMEALAEGGLRVLRGEEPVKEFALLPKGYATREEFYSRIGKKANQRQ